MSVDSLLARPEKTERGLCMANVPYVRSLLLLDVVLWLGTAQNRGSTYKDFCSEFCASDPAELTTGGRK